MKIDNNMQIYDAVRSVPKEAQKPFNNGSFSGTEIDPMWRIKKLTELFGPCGVGWYTEIVRMETLQVGDDLFAIVDINMYINVNGEWSKPIFGTGGNKLKTTTRSGVKKTSDEGFKMAYTDAISVSCKALGIGADIYWGHDKTKYTNSSPDDNPPDNPPYNPPDNPPYNPPDNPPYNSPDNPPAQDDRAGLITKDQIITIKSNCSPANVKALCAKYGIADLADMPKKTAETVIIKLTARKQGGNAQ